MKNMNRAMLKSFPLIPRSSSNPSKRALPMLMRSRNAAIKRKNRTGISCQSIFLTSCLSAFGSIGSCSSRTVLEDASISVAVGFSRVSAIGSCGRCQVLDENSTSVEMYQVELKSRTLRLHGDWVWSLICDTTVCLIRVQAELVDLYRPYSGQCLRGMLVQYLHNPEAIAAVPQLSRSRQFSITLTRSP